MSALSAKRPKLTGTLTELVTLSPSWSVMVTVKLYVPATVNVTVVFWAALVPLARKLTGPGGVPMTLQV